ncbi:mechanosensitive ion channel domain-containing protein [Helicobacter turcicus]|uniref:Mechanosensitive ion channel n=1 Tax=Helicobacter turcicus TaxID=2867412 RepID=A0ABS7JLS8_9HELI|nr:mechanosensitive ion channel domain-containing protein [Helicobacter turcicus]MBX7490351.1 mechanosensitive ion channel [Helicobacter turcicus]MBX7545070.1 mechanosensitive ion channel [Helicobacter turcicus]
MRFVIFVFLFVCSVAFGAIVEDIKTIKSLELEITNANRFLEDTNNAWMKRYSNYQSYQQVLANLAHTQEAITQLEKKPKTLAVEDELSVLKRNLTALQQQKKVLDIYKDLPFRELTEAKKLEEMPNVTNPLLIVRAYSYIQKADEELKNLNTNYKSLQSNLKWLNQKDSALKGLLQIYQAEPNKSELLNVCRSNYCLFANAEEIAKAYAENLNALTVLETTKEVFNTTLEIFSKETQENKVRLMGQVKAQFFKGIYIGITILVLIGIAFFLKLGVRKYIHDNERIYTTNKIINFLNITLIVITLLFSYLDNVGYLVTVLGFASAGLAIAMKDLFMSVLGWIVIVVGGSVHAGDRIKVIKDGAVYVGDVLDISVLRITLYEDITLTTYAQNRRAGRIIFVPNNFIFTVMFSNYTHGGMKTVWDGIDFTITFDSDHARACHIARECARKYAKGYTESTRKQFAKLRDRFTLRNTNVEPRVFSLLEQNGIRISVWYLTNAYATLALRSSISAEIINEILQEPSIQIAYPSTTVYEGKRKKEHKEAFKTARVGDGVIPPTNFS